MDQKRRHFDRDFKVSAVRMVESSGRSLEEVARSLGICGSMLRRWRSQFRRGGPESFDRYGRQKGTELERLRRENRRLREDMEILKKTIAWAKKRSLPR